MQFASAFADDLASRIEGRVCKSPPTLRAMPETGIRRPAGLCPGGKAVSTSQSGRPEWQKFRVNPLVGVKRTAVCGNPNLKTATVAHSERVFLTVRQSNKRCARKTLAYSKTYENHAATASIQTFVCNLCRKHTSLEGKTPAMALGIVDRRWTLEDVVSMADKHEAIKENATFETAFASYEFNPRNDRAVRPLQPLTPWYLDAASGGANPPQMERKPGVRYADEANQPVPVRLSELGGDSLPIF